MAIRIRKTPTTRTIPYSPAVNLSKELLLVEHTLITSDILYPDTSSLLIGGECIYKLTSDGIHYPEFSREFELKAGSQVYNKIAGAVNIIRFEYDGISFRYSITSYTSVDLPPYAVADYGLDDTVIVVAAHNVTVPIFLFDGDNIAQITVFDLLSSVHYLGERPLLYSIQRDGDQDWVTSDKAKEAKILLDCNDLGQQVFNIKVGDGLLESMPVQCSIVVKDTNLLCA